MKTIQSTIDAPVYPYDFHFLKENCPTENHPIENCSIENSPTENSPMDNCSKENYLMENYPKEKICFFDIETTGLSPRSSSIYLIGLMHYDPTGQQWLLTQWFADDYQSEPLILKEFLKALAPYAVLIHFNGNTFDIPYVRKKCKQYHIALPEYAKELFENTVDFADVRSLSKNADDFSNTNQLSKNTDDFSNSNQFFKNAYALNDTETFPENVTERLSIDLLREIRRLKAKLGLEHVNQTALEQWLGIRRTDSFDGGQLIHVFAEYIQNQYTKPAAPSQNDREKILLLHNHDDIAGMLELCSILSYQVCFFNPSSLRLSSYHIKPVQTASCADGSKNSDNSNGLYSNNSFEESDCSEFFHSIAASKDLPAASNNRFFLQLSFTLPDRVPKPLTLTHSFPDHPDLPLEAAVLTLNGVEGSLRLPLYQGELKYFFSPYQDYFYLPIEDQAIHKSVASFVEPKFRQKATASTCYTRKPGAFLPALSQEQTSRDSLNKLPLFYTGYREKPYFYEYPTGTDQTATEALLKQYLIQELRYF